MQSTRCRRESGTVSGVNSGRDRYESVLDEAVWTATLNLRTGAIWGCLGSETAANIFKGRRSHHSGSCSSYLGNFRGGLELDNGGLYGRRA